MELIDVLNDKSQPTEDGWLTTREILVKKHLDPENKTVRERMLKQLKALIREGLIEQTLVMRPKTIGGAMSTAPAFRVKHVG